MSLVSVAYKIRREFRLLVGTFGFGIFLWAWQDDLSSPALLNLQIVIDEIKKS